MFKLLLFTLFVAAANAAPHHSWHHSPFQRHRHGLPSHYHSDDIFSDDVFDTRRFWSELSRELLAMDTMLEDFYKHFPSVDLRQGYEDDHYKINIPLKGFDESDVVVKAKDGVLMVQAVHKLEDGGSNEKMYMDVRTLPDNVDISGTYTYENDVLSIVFPVKKTPESGAKEEDVDAGQGHSREEMEPNATDDVGDVDLTVHTRNEGNNDSEILTNEIPSRSDQLEATTYAVDLKNEVEFVPVRYK